MEEEPDFECAAADWLRQWREIDYSWQGLAAHPCPGWFVDAGGRLRRDAGGDDVRPATLQDYWRDEEDHLLSHGGVSWTAAHAPLDAACDTDYARAALNRLRQRLSGISDAHPIDLTGCISIDQSWLDRSAIRASWALLQLKRLAPDLRLVSCLVQGANSLGVECADDDSPIELEDSLVAPDIDIRGASIGSLSLLGSVCAGSVSLHDVAMTGPLLLDDADVHGQFVARDCRFTHLVSLDAMRCRDALRLLSCRFDGGLTGEEMLIGGDAEVAEGNYSGPVSLHRSRFEGEFVLRDAVCGTLDVSMTRTEGECRWSDCDISGSVSCFGARWVRGFTLERIRFARAIDFRETNAKTACTLDDVHFATPPLFGRLVIMRHPAGWAEHVVESQMDARAWREFLGPGAVRDLKRRARKGMKRDGLQ